MPEKHNLSRLLITAAIISAFLAMFIAFLAGEGLRSLEVNGILRHVLVGLIGGYVAFTGWMWIRKLDCEIRSD